MAQATRTDTPGLVRADAGDESWRESVRKGMLTAAAVLAPPIVVAAITFRSAPSSWIDDAVLGACGVLLPLLRLATAWSSARRAVLLLIVACSTSIYLLGRIGLAVGLGVSLATFSVLALVSASRRAGLAIVATTTAAYFIVGLLASHHLLTVTGADTDPYRMRNWVRMATTSALLSMLLLSVVDYVIRHVEQSSRAAREALAQLQEAVAELAAQEQDLRIAYERLGQLHQKLEATKEEERRFLSRELHDELGQTLTALKLRLQLRERTGSNPTGAPRGGYAEPLAMVDDLISRVRKISVDLRPPLLDEVGLVSALRVYLESQAVVSGLSIALHTDGGNAQLDARLPPDFEIACFRVVQESITNALRHAAARHLDVHLTWAADRLSLSIRDDGRGFDPATLDAAAAQGHLGVVGMRERIRARGGLFKLTSSPGAGTAVEVELNAPPML